MALDIPDDPTFYRREWTVQRIGWGCMLLIIVAAATGLAGRGPLGEASAGEGPLRIRYDRIMRHSAPGTITVYLGQSSIAADSGSNNMSNSDQETNSRTVTRLWVDRAMIDACGLQGMIPEPARTVLHGDTLYLDFYSVPLSLPTTITITCEPENIGRHRGTLGLVDGPEYVLHTFVLP